ncbi:hypothetical protein ACHAO8_008607 [Botrytis cinerea]
MSSAFAETAEPLENQSTSGLYKSNDVGKASKSEEDRDQEGKSKSTQDCQKASENAKDNEATVSTRIEPNTATKSTESQAKEAAGTEENEDSRSNGHHNDYPKTADDKIHVLKRRVLDLETQFGVTSKEIIRSKYDRNSLYYNTSDETDLDHTRPYHTRPHQTDSDQTDASVYESLSDAEDEMPVIHYPLRHRGLHRLYHRSEPLPRRSYAESWKRHVKLQSHGGHSDGLHSDTEEVSKKNPVRLIPKLNPVEWKNFKPIPSPLDGVYTIDVLIGEPNITFASTRYRRQQGMQASRGDSLREVGYSDQKTTSQPSGKTPAVGQTALPERIRINSQYIIRILSKICRSDFSDSSNSPVLLLRPFKALIFYEEEIRTQHTVLNAKFGKKTAIVGDTEPKDLSIAVDSDDQPLSTIIEGHSNESAPKTEVDSTSDHFMEADNLDLGSETEFNELNCLIEFMDHYIKDKKKYLESSSCQKVVFSDIWHLFKPGDEVMEGKIPQAYRVISVSSKKHGFKRQRWISDAKVTINYGPVTVHCVYIDYDGKRLGPVSKHFTIQEYEGEQNVTSLPVYPLRFHKKINREGLVARGKLFLETAGVKHMHCAGLTLDTRDEVDSQVMIDFEEALLRQEIWAPSIENLADAAPDSEVENKEESANDCDLRCCKSEIHHNDSYVDRDRKESFIESQYSAVSQRHSSLTIVPRSLQEARGDNFPSQDEFLIMSYPKLNLGDITEVRRVDDKNGFDQLVLPKGHKDMVKCLIRQHFREKESNLKDKNEMDIVRGKGKGLIMLLHGAPGVGKTSTAECVADSFRKPLFQITCGDLGSEATEVEAALETNFSLANRWGCILLIDEADIFLAERTRHDFLRNALVAVFLRVLEYYAGILFLTTNRVGAFDEAFTSRIHVSLYYPQLNWNSTLEIFKMNMQRVKDRFVKRNRDFEIDGASIGAFAKSYFDGNREGRWNGRQIRNAFQTALALAEYDAQGDGDAVSLTDNTNKKVILKGSHFEIVSEAYLGFANYLKEVNHGVGVAKRALDRSYRDDDFGEPKSASWSRLEERRGGISPTPSVTSTQRHLPDHNFQDDHRQQFSRMTRSGVPVSNYDQSYHNNHYQDPGLNSNFLNSGDGRQSRAMGPNRGNNFPQDAQSFREDSSDVRDLGRNYTTSSERGMRTAAAQHPSQLHQGSQAWSTSDRMERNNSSNYASYPSGPNTFGMERRGFYTEDEYDNQSERPSMGVEEQRTNAGGFQNTTSQG